MVSHHALRFRVSFLVNSEFPPFFLENAGISRKLLEFWAPNFEPEHHVVLFAPCLSIWHVLNDIFQVNLLYPT